MATRSKSRVRKKRMSNSDVQSVSSSTPTNTAGAEVVVPQDDHDTGEPYPVVEIKDEEQHRAEQEAAAEKRVKRAKTATGPRKLSGKEVDQLRVLFDLLGAQELTTAIPLESIPEDIKNSFFTPTHGERNLLMRGLAKPVYAEQVGEDGRQVMTGVTITDIAQYLYDRKTAKPEEKQSAQKSTGVRTRSTSKYEGLRIRKLVDQNPRQANVQGWHSFNLYQDGMTVTEYLNTKGPAAECSNGTMFDGPKLIHFEWDMNHGYIGLYRDGEPETLDDGSPNPKYWAVNLSGNQK